ncbi:MAG: hypothetical protein WCX06_00540 [Candidatus Paceibacterota bacterium]
MDEEARRILEFRTESGELLCRIRLIVKGDPSTGQQGGKEDKGDSEKGGNGNGERPPADGGNYAPMTDAQKRYLFRLLAEKGIEKDAAHEELKKTFGVGNLKQVTKMEASREIERRLARQKGGGGNGSL